MECIRSRVVVPSRIPPVGPVTGDKRAGKAGEVGKCRRNGLSFGVEGISDAEVRKLVFSIPGVWIDRFVGFRRPVLSGPLSGENGVERA